ncbi:MAG TPA: ATP synthase F0 subunit C [Chthonomonadales bacterium]|nr:ATP synthase F0 subunit C [Chthonomonadales bacterium]
MIYFAILALVVGIGLPLAVFAGATSQARVATTALEGMARQPAEISRLQTAMILGLAFIESLVIFTFVFMFLLKASIPADPTTVIELLKATGAR